MLGIPVRVWSWSPSTQRAKSQNPPTAFCNPKSSVSVQLMLKKLSTQDSYQRRLKSRIERVGNFAVIATMVFIGLQWWEMRTGSRDTHQIAVQARQQAAAAEALAKAVYSQQRPWMGLADELRPEGIASSNGVLVARLSVPMKNFGQSPALRTMPYGSISSTEPTGELVDRVCQEAMDFSRGWTIRTEHGPENIGKRVGNLIFPGDKLTVRVQIYGSPATSLVGVKQLWVYGCISYEDQQGTHHSTRFCARTLPNVEGGISSDSFFRCEYFNDGD